MSEESQDNKCTIVKRRLSDGEKALIIKMVKGTSVENQVLYCLPDIYVYNMNDGGMGSIRFCHEDNKKRLFGRYLSEGKFKDKDGVLVSVTINLDKQGDIFELDIWKFNNSPLMKFPNPDEVEMIGKPVE